MDFLGLKQNSYRRRSPELREEMFDYLQAPFFQMFLFKRAKISQQISVKRWMEKSTSIFIFKVFLKFLEPKKPFILTKRIYSQSSTKFSTDFTRGLLTRYEENIGSLT